MQFNAGKSPLLRYLHVNINEMLEGYSDLGRIEISKSQSDLDSEMSIDTIFQVRITKLIIKYRQFIRHFRTREREPMMFPWRAFVGI